jgi:hypothetical protein
MEKLSNPEINKLEETLGVRLPGLYRKLLVELGWGDIGHRCEIYHPSQVRGLYEPFFDDPAQLFAPYFPFGCNNGTQEVWVIDSARDLAASIWHETVPEDWPEEQWLSYEVWVEENLPQDES